IKKGIANNIMNCSDTPLLSELELDELILDMGGAHDDHVMDYSYEEEFAAVLGQNFQSYFSAGVHNNSSPSSSSSSDFINNNININSITPTNIEPEQNPDNHSKFDGVVKPPHQDSSTPIILNFGNSNRSKKVKNDVQLNPEQEAAVSEIFKSYNVNSEESIHFSAQQAKKRSRIRPPSQTYDHIVAERKRREQLSQLFIALSAIVPGLKKMDKTSVLGDAIKYLKHLQERVGKLEEQAANQTIQSAVLVKKSQIIEEDEGSSDEKSGCSEEQMLPEIEAKVCRNNILLKIQCEKQKGVLVNLLSKLDTLGLVVVSTNVTRFGNLILDITIIAEVSYYIYINVNRKYTV
ncbi:hypothetical protein RD792_016639, partial [Penstemon davidsonii]